MKEDYTEGSKLIGVLLFTLTWAWCSFCLIPLFKLISPKAGDWTVLALFTTSFLVAFIVNILLDIKRELDKLNE